MEVKLFGLTFRLEVVAICILLGWVLGAFLFCSCVKVTPLEGFEMIKSSIESMVSKASQLGSLLNYKIDAGIEVKKNSDDSVVGFMGDFKKDHEGISYKAACGA